jgi:hypothetical protein|tara:strand:+ start:2845 stop:3213 length:369 start_codon:yes stop_codon:yes gene_type:complete
MRQPRNRYISRDFLATADGEKLVKMIKDGHSDEALAFFFGFGKHQVRRVRLHKLGIKRTASRDTAGKIITDETGAPKMQHRPNLDFKITLTGEQVSILSKLAEAEYRSPDNQLLYLLSKVLK